MSQKLVYFCFQKNQKALAAWGRWGAHLPVLNPCLVRLLGGPTGGGPTLTASGEPRVPLLRQLFLMATFFETRSFCGFTEDQQKYYKEHRLSQKGKQLWEFLKKSELVC